MFDQMILGAEAPINRATYVSHGFIPGGSTPGLAPGNNYLMGGNSSDIAAQQHNHMHNGLHSEAHKCDINMPGKIANLKSRYTIHNNCARY